MNVVYFGTDVFLSCFEYFAERHHILALYTYHNDEDYFTEYAIVRRAQELGVPVHYESISPEEMARYLREAERPLFFSAEYDRVLPVLEGMRGINVHSSLLPQGRGYYPLEGAMERGLFATGVTMHKLAPRLDYGDILARRTVAIGPEVDSIDLYLRCAAAAREMLETVLADLDAAWAGAAPQTGRLPCWRRPAPERLTLTHSQTTAQAADVFRLYNSLSQVELARRWYYVTALLPGAAPLDAAERRLAEDRWLYRTADGHLRLNVCPKSEKEETT